jgi:hypothetical protein
LPFRDSRPGWSIYQSQSPELLKKCLEFSMAIEKSDIEKPIRDLVDIRASQMNGCAK